MNGRACACRPIAILSFAGPAPAEVSARLDASVGARRPSPAATRHQMVVERRLLYCKPIDRSRQRAGLASQRWSPIASILQTYPGQAAAHRPPSLAVACGRGATARIADQWSEGLNACWAERVLGSMRAGLDACRLQRCPTVRACGGLTFSSAETAAPLPTPSTTSQCHSVVALVHTCSR